MATNTPHGTKNAKNGRAKNTTLHFQSNPGQLWFLAHSRPAIVGEPIVINRFATRLCAVLSPSLAAKEANMIIAFPKEIKDNEYRVNVINFTIRLIIPQGDPISRHTVRVRTNFPCFTKTVVSEGASPPVRRRPERLRGSRRFRWRFPCRRNEWSRSRWQFVRPGDDTGGVQPSVAGRTRWR